MINHKFESIMIQFDDEHSMEETIGHVASMVEQGYTFGYDPD